MKIPYFQRQSKVPFINYWLYIDFRGFSLHFGYEELYYDGITHRSLNIKPVVFYWADDNVDK
jgi:hypothetical protein